MQALILDAVKSPLQMVERESPQPASNEVRVSLRAAALNRRDFWITRGMYPGIQTPVVLGSDGAGIVTDCGADVDSEWNGAEVIINPGFDWGTNESHQAADFTILGMPVDGTFATEIVVPASALHRKPQHLTWEEAAALPLAGVTAWRALFSQADVKSTDRVLISGVGGGVASFALQFAIAHGADVWVTSSSDEKIAAAVALGARGGFDYRSDAWVKTAAAELGGADVIIDGAGGSGYASLLEIAAPGGRVVNYGATAGPAEKVDLFKLFWKQLQLCGSTMGSPSDFDAMLNFVATHSLKPIIDRVLPLAEGNEAIAAMRDSVQFGKFVLTMIND